MSRRRAPGRLLPSEAAVRPRRPPRPRTDPLGPSRHERPQLIDAHAKLRLDWQRATTAHLRSVYPFQADRGFGARGVYMGVHVTGGMSSFIYDPFELYPHTLTNPNGIITGAVGAGKSATIKALLRRSLAIYGPRRFVVVLDPKGEYQPLAADLGLPTLKLHPGGADRLNPMDPPPDGPADDVVARQSFTAALVAAVLGRGLDPTEDALLGWAIQALVRSAEPFTITELIGAVRHPVDALIELSGRDRDTLTAAATPIVFALDKLTTRTLAGMFDGRTTIGTEWLAGPGLVLDLSAVYQDRVALPLVMLAATTWLTTVLTRRWERRTLQVLDEAWAAVLHGARHLQASLKLARAYGVSTWLVCHRPADLTAQADDGTSAAKLAGGLLADIDTRIIGRQPPDQVPVAAELFGLNEAETAIIPQLPRGRALWQLQGRSAVVQGQLTAAEHALFDTDNAMRA